MELFLNDRSYICPGALSDHWEVITCFGDLMRGLRHYGVSKVICPSDYKSILLGDIYLRDCYCPLEKLSEDQRKELISLVDSSFRKVRDEDIDHTIRFELAGDAGQASVFLGNAYTRGLPVVSFVFNPIFKANQLAGTHYKGIDARAIDGNVKNVHTLDTEPTLAETLTSFNCCRSKNAEQEPMWNQEKVEGYLKWIGHSDSRHSASADEKQAYLIKHGTIIAQMNGWEHSPKLSSRNTSAHKKRVIFYSKAFRHKDTYLCIDLEKETFHFELCDYQGRHLREINYKGEITDSTPQRDHNIIVRGV